MIGYTLLRVKSGVLAIINCTDDMHSTEDYAESGRVWLSKELAADAAAAHNNDTFEGAHDPVYVAQITLPDPL